MAAANPSSISASGIRQPYHIILAGAHDAGKSTIFNTLVTEFQESFKFKAEDKRSARPGVQFESFRHKYMEEAEMSVRHALLLLVGILINQWNTVHTIRS
jgi:septin family protein